MNICDHSIVIFGIRGFCLEFLKTSHVDILYRFRNSVVDTVKTDGCIFKKRLTQKKKMKIQYANEFFQNLGMGYPTKCVYQFIYDENDNDETKIIIFLLCMGWYYASR